MTAAKFKPSQSVTSALGRKKKKNTQQNNRDAKKKSGMDTVRSCLAAAQPTSSANSQRELSRGCTRCVRMFARLAPNRTPSRHLSTIAVCVFPPVVYASTSILGTESHVQSALVDKIGTLLPLFGAGSGNLLSK